MISRRRALLLVSVFAVASFDRVQSASDKEKPLVYDDITEGADGYDRQAKKIYTAIFRFIDVTQEEGFRPGGMKGLFTSSIRFRDPRSMRDDAIPGKIVYAFIVTPDGRVIEPRVLHSTDQRVSKYILGKIRYDRYFPARYRGVPVYSLHLDSWEFGGPDTNSPRQDNDGLGVYHSRDR
jgi:hypothetical protein